MTLKVELDNLDGVDESLHGLYIKGDDERFRLDVEAMPDVSGIKNALNDERTKRKDLSAKLKKFDGVDLDYYNKVNEQKDLFAKYEETGGVDETAINTQVESRVTKMREDHEGVIGDLNGKLHESNNRLSKIMVDQALTSVAMSAGVQEGAVEDILRRGKDVFKVVDGVVVPQRGNGDTIYGKDGVQALTQEEWMGELKNNAPHLFKPSRAAGPVMEMAVVAAGLLFVSRKI